jgi:hypothetical protein
MCGTIYEYDRPGEIWRIELCVLPRWQRGPLNLLVLYRNTIISRLSLSILVAPPTPCKRQLQQSSDIERKTIDFLSSALQEIHDILVYTVYIALYILSQPIQKNKK